MIPKFRKIKDYCLVGDGAHASIQRQESGVMYLTSKNFKNYGLDLSKVDYISEKNFEKYFKISEKAITNLLAGDVLLSIIGSLGSPYVVKRSDKFGLSSSVAIIRPNNDLCPKYLFLFMQSSAFQTAVDAIKSGSAQGFLSLEMIRNLPVVFYKKDIQKKIASVLSAYDDLIENNKRRIALLEKIAEEIYREWFVRMRFPGYKETKFEKGLPFGWSNKPSSEVLHILGGGTPKTDIPIFWDGEIPFFTPKDATDYSYILNTEKALTQKGLESCSSSLFNKNTIFITARGTVGKIALSYRKMAMNQSCYALLPKSENEIYFYYLSMKNAVAYVKGVSKSGVFDNIVIDTFKIIPLLVPNENLISGFNSKIEPTFKLIGTLLESNENLIKTRNMLLSRLISGKLSVENLDIKFPPSMREDEEKEKTANA